MLNDLGIATQVRIHSDSSSGRAMCYRLGAGSAKHVETKYFHLQTLVMARHLSIHKVEGSYNVADLGTKSVTAAVLTTLVPMLGLVRMRDLVASRSEVAAVSHPTGGSTGRLVAALLVIVQALGVKGASSDEEESDDIATWWLPFFVTCTALFLAQMTWSFWQWIHRAMKGTHDVSSQTSPSQTSPSQTMALGKIVVSSHGEKYHRSRSCWGLTKATELRELSPCAVCARRETRRPLDDG